MTQGKGYALARDERSLNPATGLAGLKELIDDLEVKLDDPASGLGALAILIAAAEAKLDKLAGDELEGTAANLDAFGGVASSGETGADVLTISTTTRKKIHALMIDISGLTAGATATIRMYTKTLDADVALTKFYDQDFTVGTDPNLIPVISGTIGIRNDLRVEIQSSNAADTSISVDYHYIREDAE